MDQIKKFTTNELIILAGALLVFIGTFLAWFKVDAFGFSDSVNGFHYFLQGTIPWILSILVGAVVVIRKIAPNVKLPELPMAWNQVILIATAIIAVLILTRIVSTDGPSEVVDRGIGIFLAMLGGLAQLVGAGLKFQAKESDAGPSSSSTPPTPF